MSSVLRSSSNHRGSLDTADFNASLFHSRAKPCPTPSPPSRARPTWRVWGPPRPTWCRSELERWPATAAIATPWTSAPVCTVGTSSLTLCIPRDLLLPFSSPVFRLFFFLFLIASHCDFRAGCPLIRPEVFVVLHSHSCVIPTQVTLRSPCRTSCLSSWARPRRAWWSLWPWLLSLLSALSECLIFPFTAGCPM